MKKHLTQYIILTALFYFLIAILLGTLLRMASVTDFVFNYRYITHTHSHMALLGWVYGVLTAIVNHSFLPKNKQKSYKKIFIFTQITLLGMLLSFPFQGYGIFSIVWSSLFLVATYWYSFFLLRNISNTQSASFLYLKSALFFLIFSSFGIWMLPIIIHFFGKYTSQYNALIYFFLHFQYNGFILSILMSLWIRYLENRNIMIFRLKKYFWLYIFGILGSVCLSWTELFNRDELYWIGLIAVLSWLFVLLRLGKIYNALQEKSVLLKGFVILLLIKTCFLLLISFPQITQQIFFNLDLIISYLHFTFLGVITIGILFSLKEFVQIEFPKWTLIFYFSVFILSEMLITYKGLAIWLRLPFLPFHSDILACVSAFFIVPISFWFVSIYKSIFYR